MSDVLGWIVHRYGRVGSTMDIAAALARLGAPDRSAVVAGAQTAGRGRGGRSWVSAPGAALYCTLVLRPAVAPDRLSALPILAGVAVAEAIEQVTQQPVQLKWPNDVWLGNDPARRKVAGILVTSRFSAGRVESALVGVGVNIGAPHEALPPGGTSLLAATGVQTTPDAMLEDVLDRFERIYTAFRDARGRPSLAAWTARAALLGETVTIEDAGRQHTGLFTGIDDDGALLLEEPGAVVRRIVAGNLTRGPRETIAS